MTVAELMGELGKFDPTDVVCTYDGDGYITPIADTVEPIIDGIEWHGERHSAMLISPSYE